MHHLPLMSSVWLYNYWRRKSKSARRAHELAAAEHILQPISQSDDDGLRLPPSLVCPSNHVRARAPTLVAFSVGVNERSDHRASSSNTSRDTGGGGAGTLSLPLTAPGARNKLISHMSMSHRHVRARTRADRQRRVRISK